MRRSRPRTAERARRAGRGGFTLIELIFVMLLLAVAASLVAPRMASFFRGRALNFEARRLLSLAQHAQSRAVAEGVPVLLWIDARAGTYGVELAPGHDDGGDERAVSYAAEPTVTLQPETGTQAVSEQDDETLGLPEGRAVIRFNPEGYCDEASVARIVLQQREGAALELVQTENRLGYEIRALATQP